MTIGYSFQSLHSDNGFRVVFRGIVGSRAYGTNRLGSDEDVRGVFLVPPAEYALLTTPPEQVADERNDRVYYSLGRFAELATASLSLPFSLRSSRKTSAWRPQRGSRIRNGQATRNWINFSEGRS